MLRLSEHTFLHIYVDVSIDPASTLSFGRGIRPADVNIHDIPSPVISDELGAGNEMPSFL